MDHVSEETRSVLGRGHEEFMASGKDSDVYRVNLPESAIARKKFYSSEYLRRDDRIKDYADLMNKGASLPKEELPSLELLGKKYAVRINPVSRAYWDEVEKKWITESPFVEGTNLGRAFEAKGNGANTGWRRVMEDKNLPSFISLDQYFDFLDSLTALQKIISEKLGVIGLHIGVENVMFTPEGNMVITDLGHNIKALFPF